MNPKQLIGINHIKEKLKTYKWKSKANNIFIKKDRKIKITLQSNFSSKKIEYNYTRNKKDYLDVDWDYLIFTDIDNVWVFPYEYMKRKDEKGYRISNNDDCFKNTFELLEMDEKHIMYFLIDNHKQNE